MIFAGVASSGLDGAQSIRLTGFATLPGAFIRDVSGPYSFDVGDEVFYRFGPSFPPPLQRSALLGFQVFLHFGIPERDRLKNRQIVSLKAE